VGHLGTNQALSLEVVEWLVRAGVRTICLCPGGRNAPLVEVLDALSRPETPPASRLEILDFFEERSAAFFALGRARRDRRPAAVITTSGTAAAELLPALIEAHYSGTPMVAVTADRPRTYRGTGAPQTIEQVNLFGPYVRASVDLDMPGALDAIGPLVPSVHLNVCFDEPLIEGPAIQAADAEMPVQPAAIAPRSPAALPTEWIEAVRLLQHPLVILGSLPQPEDQQAALDACCALGAPVLAEASSHLKARLASLAFVAGETAVRRAFERQVFDGVLRIGEVPSFRVWRDLEELWRVPVLSLSRTPFPGLTRGKHFAVPTDAAMPSLSDLAPGLFPEDLRHELLSLDRELAAATDELLIQFPRSEPALVRQVSEAIPGDAFVYLGNSLPIREWNQFARFEGRSHIIGENRGANGIDGQVSSFLGAAVEGRENWAVVGDLTALYDLPSLWALRHVAAPVRLVVVNNGGGRIFQRLYRSPRFQNVHQVRLRGWAEMWDVAYRCDLAAASGALPETVVFELTPDGEQTEAFWQALRARVPA
jgi:2-succinyl-5-enolpyruvyl-6-hydroxy-3-cyclohexene-1-carboxylate synthase